MLTGEQAAALGEWRVRKLWPTLTMADKYIAVCQLKWRNLAKEDPFKEMQEFLWSKPLNEE